MQYELTKDSFAGVKIKLTMDDCPAGISQEEWALFLANARRMKFCEEANGICQKGVRHNHLIENEERKQPMPKKIEFPESATNAMIEMPEELSRPSGSTCQVPTMVSINKAAEITGLSYDLIRNMCLNNEIVFIKSGTRFLINLEKLIAKMNGEA